MKAEAIQALEQFKQQHLAGDLVSQSHSVPSTKVNPSRVPKKINYPDHVKPLKERIMSALNNGCRTPDSVATYCSEDIKLITLQLGRWVSRGLIGKHTNVVSGITRYYPHDIAKEKGFLTEPKPINRKKGKKAKPTQKLKRAEDPRQMPLWYDTKKGGSKFVYPQSLQKADDMLNTANNLATAEQLMQHEALKKHCTFLENQVKGWQAESRKQAHEITKLQDALINARKTRDVTSEVTEVMEEVTQLRATVAYLESKLFGRK
jgi:hypothetical protein